MVSDQDLARGVETLLRQSDPTSLTSLTSVVHQLEAKLGLDLSDKTNFIRDHINLLLRSPPPASASSSTPHPPPQYLQQLHSGVNVPAKGHFALHPRSQQYPLQHFSLQRPPPYHSYDLNFQQPYPPYMPPPPQHHQRQGPSVSQSPKARVSPELQVVVGEPALPRTEIVRQLWAYIRKNNLQDPSNKRKIICDDALRVVFETDCTDMFKMNKLLAKHILPLDPSKDSSQAKRAKAKTETETKEPVSSTSSTVSLSEPLAKFFGTGEMEMTDEEIIRRVWEYIKLNHLEDPANPMAIQCDEKLRELLGCESISAVGINEMLRRHIS
uniref:DM2 domain-containing protein n=1 Tax=Brassica oleracea var. oleracea TaxID=109376 RepID=A0A0D3BKY0_BRAOL